MNCKSLTSWDSTGASSGNDDLRSFNLVNDAHCCILFSFCACKIITSFFIHIILLSFFKQRLDFLKMKYTMMFESGPLMEMGEWRTYLFKKFQNFFLILHYNIGLFESKVSTNYLCSEQNYSSFNFLISLEYNPFNIIPKSLVTLQFLKFLIPQIIAYIQGFQMRYQSFLGHWYPNSYS